MLREALVPLLLIQRNNYAFIFPYFLPSNMGSNLVTASYIFMKACCRLTTCLLVLVPGLRLGSHVALCSAMNSVFDFRESCSVFVSYLYAGKNTMCCHHKCLQRYVHGEF